MPGAEGGRPIPYVDIGGQAAGEKAGLMAAIEAVLVAGDHIGGGAIAALEAELKPFVGTEHVVALNSGTDALMLSMKALGVGPGDEVITPPNSFVASTAAIVHLGARPVFADVLADQNIDPEQIQRKISPKTKVIMPVHLTGRICDMGPIMDVAERHGLLVIEDAAQAIGSRYDGRLAGSFGRAGCFSAHPLKNLNAAGDAGYVSTNDGQLAERLRRMRNHGLVDRNTVAEFGYVSRLDTLQAAILRIRLGRLADTIDRRRRNARLYQDLLDSRYVYAPPCRNNEFNTFHTFVIQVDRRDRLKDHLAELGIGTGIHYPIPIHLQPAAAGLGYGKGDFPVTERQAGRILTLPVHQGLSEDEVRRVAAAVNEFCRNGQL
jgi:dTDP-4-amino-4,6-dideoxygalactose transaminase